jgi:hypothetical protein
MTRAKRGIDIEARIPGIVIRFEMALPTATTTNAIDLDRRLVAYVPPSVLLRLLRAISSHGKNQSRCECIVGVIGWLSLASV